ncbi:MAG: diaminopimelate epimerase [Bacteroidetes bacterium SW_11_45_7]|nr:MAG: diaminopimelate epimerase [Bacteroidetes bacterium SW_11_45_7]
MTIPFVKYHGTGNDFILIDNRSEWFPEDHQTLIANLCQRRFGIGADGLICIRHHHEVAYKMVYFNADGREGSMCGNGSRCAVAFAGKLGMIKGARLSFEAYDGIHEASINTDSIAVQMADVTAIERIGEDFFIDTGSPHYIQFHHDIDQMDVESKGRSIRNSAPYAEKGVNVNFVELRDNQPHKLRTYERGVEAETYSCGTGAVAAAIAAEVIQKKAPQLNDISHQRLYAKGGELAVHFQFLKNDTFSDVWLEGPVQEVFSGEAAYGVDDIN